MKKILSAALLFWGLGLQAQSVTPEVVAASGGYFTSVNAQLSWTLGEPVIDTWDNVTATLTQGFQQSTYYVSGINDLDDDILVTVFPNPSAGMVNVSISGTAHRYTQAYIINTAGQKVAQASLSGRTTVSLDLSGFASGTYVLSILDEKNIQQSMTIIKQ